MTLNGKAIAIMACLQMCGATLCYLGGHFGVHIFAVLSECDEPGPPIMQACARAGPWLLLVPLLWAGLVLYRAQREAAAWEMNLWFVLALAFALVAGGCGILAGLTPLLGGCTI